MARSFGANICGDFEQATRREWMETNGLGGYASSSITLCNTRRYHGLLVAAVEPPVVRRVLLSKLEATLCADDARYELGTNKWPGAVHPTGYEYIVSFTGEPWPTWVYAAGGWRLQQEVLMVEGLNATIVRWTLLQADRPLTLEIRPKLTSRDFHSLGRRHDFPKPVVSSAAGRFMVHWQDGRCGLTVTHDGSFRPEPDYYYNYVYDREQERGFDYQEDLFHPGVIRCHLSPGATAGVVASVEPIDARSVQALIDRERARRQGETFALLGNDAQAVALARATRHFLVRRGPGWTVIAGYPWFGDWGRDTFVSLPGLALVTGRHQVARSILKNFAQHVSEGMMPNCFPDCGDPPAYNTVDAALWFIYALGKYQDYTGDQKLSGELFPVVCEILQRYEHGTRYGIRLDADGLLSAGRPGLQLTWMDAKIGDRVVTPRAGKPVEIQALWYHGLQFGKRVAVELGQAESAEHYASLMRRAEDSFERAFWNRATGCCCDLFAPEGTGDPAVRPNQLLVIALADRLLSPRKQKQLVETVTRELLTPMGLRTLSPADPLYAGRYQGDSRSRDAAYHQGTVWPWLMGPYITAYLKAYGRSERARRHARACLEPLFDHLDEAGVGHISELADGDEPHTPRGCIAQAWSLAEPLRAIYEDLLPSARVSGATPRQA